MAAVRGAAFTAMAAFRLAAVVLGKSWWTRRNNQKLAELLLPDTPTLSLPTATPSPTTAPTADPTTPSLTTAPTADPDHAVYFILGDSVGRYYAAALGRRLHARVGSRAAVKQQCEKTKVVLGKYRGVRASPSCVFGKHVKFAWFQWFAAPAAEYTIGAKFSHAQGIDVCTPFTAASCAGNATACSFSHCMADFLSGASNTSVLVIRGGLQYLLFASTYAAKHLHTVRLQDWQDVMRRELQQLLALLDRVFAGRVVWLLLAPFATFDMCKPPLRDVGFLVPEANRVLGEVLRATGVTVVDPTEFHRGWTNVSTSNKKHRGKGYFDCVHFLDPMVGETVSAVLEAVGRGGK